MQTQTDQAGKEFWDSAWSKFELPPPIEPRAAGFWHRLDRAYHQFFQQAFAGRETRNAPLLEIGCARSVWLPYFAREFGFEVHGLDYSELGCDGARAVLASAGVQGEVHLADLFAPPASLRRRFDVVVSFGVMEHFTDTRGAIAAAAEFLRPGGIVCTLVPNMSGLMGTIQRRVNRPAYDIHVPLTREQLRAAHAGAGLEVLSCDYLLFSNLNVLNIWNVRDESPRLWRFANRAFSAIDRVLALVERALPAGLRTNPFTSPYVACVAMLPRAAGRLESRSVA